MQNTKPFHGKAKDDPRSMGWMQPFPLGKHQCSLNAEFSAVASVPDSSPTAGGVWDITSETSQDLTFPGRQQRKEDWAMLWLQGIEEGQKGHTANPEQHQGWN